MQVKFVTLSENTVSGVGFWGEWGLSILVQTEELTFLLDTGPGRSAAYNAERLGVSLAKVDKIVLSHGHFDHTGGLSEILPRTGNMDIIAHPDVWAAKYSLPRDNKPRMIGIPFPQAELEDLGAVFTLSQKPVWLTDNIVTTGEIPMVTDFEEIDSNLYVEDEGEVFPDELLDDRGVIIKTDAGLIVFSGCAHRGIINTLYHAREITGEDRVYAVIGGTHLIRASDQRTALTIAELKQMGIQKIGVSHCTGQWASALLAHEFGRDIFFFNNAGTQMTLDLI
jgi:7,8-dihydropterin-6-yl-methyl-4-(beta-D-ribofuranosyl)aminobenzene 5'-phosphate synthase